jgi:precorrin-2 dehydrogenase / sirohydrochlorin ferrochelatase
MSRLKPYYPVFLDLKGKKCLVIGGGEVALRKIKMLLGCGAKVTVISPAFHPDLRRLAKRRSVRLIQRSYQSGDLKGGVIVISATDDAKTNKRVSEEAREKGVLVNVIDDPKRSDFIVPSILRRGGLTIAVSTSGMSPAVAKKIRTKLEGEFGEEYALLLTLIEEVRSKVKEQGVSVSAEAWQEALDLDLLTKLVRTGQRKKAKAVLLKALNRDH